MTKMERWHHGGCGWYRVHLRSFVPTSHKAEGRLSTRAYWSIHTWLKINRNLESAVPFNDYLQPYWMCFIFTTFPFTKQSMWIISFHFEIISDPPPLTWQTITPEVMLPVCSRLQAVISPNNYIVVCPAFPQISCCKRPETSCERYLKGNTQQSHQRLLKGDF